MPAPRVVAIVGPTAAGKSDLAVDLALRIGGEVVSADSMQLYKGMDIGTAKLPVGRRRGVPHHLLDLLEVTQPSTVAEFQGLARAAIADCGSRVVTPIVVGGSALYVRAVLDRFEFPGSDPVVRERLEGELTTRGAAALHRRLSRQDPAAGSRILPSNGRRIVRALEVIQITGRPYSAQLPAHRSVYDDVRMIGLNVPRPVLARRIHARVEHMWQAGLVEEVRRLERAGLRQGRTASRALGYAQVLRFLAGEITEAQALEESVGATRRFARRQDSWFRRDPRITWAPYDAEDLLERVTALVAH